MILKRARARHVQLVKVAKEEDWREFTGTLSERTPKSKVYEAMRRIKGKTPRKTHILHEDNITYSTIQDIAEKIADSFAKVSSDENYSPAFAIHKQQTESNQLNFDSNNGEYYNAPFTDTELHYHLSRLKNTSPGPDCIYYDMMKYLPPQAKTYLLGIYNRFWSESFFPSEWSHSIIIPVPKPGKDHSKAYNYRPIALISCLYKTLVRMINFRLLEHLEFTNVLTSIQCGCRKNRSTLDNLIRLENFLKEAFVRNQHVISVFFDIEKAYDMTWRYGIC